MNSNAQDPAAPPNIKGDEISLRDLFSRIPIVQLWGFIVSMLGVVAGAFILGLNFSELRDALEKRPRTVCYEFSVDPNACTVDPANLQVELTDFSVEAVGIPTPAFSDLGWKNKRRLLTHIDQDLKLLLMQAVMPPESDKDCLQLILKCKVELKGVRDGTMSVATVPVPQPLRTAMTVPIDVHFATGDIGVNAKVGIRIAPGCGN